MFIVRIAIVRHKKSFADEISRICKASFIDSYLCWPFNKQHQRRRLLCARLSVQHSPCSDDKGSLR